MKRLGRRAKRRLAIIQQKRDRRRARRLERRRARLGVAFGRSVNDAPRAAQHAPQAHRVTLYHSGRTYKTWAIARKEMPADFCLSDNHDVVAGFIAELRHNLVTLAVRLDRDRMEGGQRRLAKQGRRIVESYVDFATMQRITPAAALVLASEYDRARSIFDEPKWLQAINVDLWKPDVLTVLDDVGFLSLLGVEPPRNRLSSRDGIYIVPFLSGTKVIGAQLDALIRAMAALASSEGIDNGEMLLNRTRIYDGLGEAIQNVEDHAYPDDFDFQYPVLKQWWITGAVEPRKKRFNIVAYDQGITIPVHLPRWNLYDAFRQTFLSFVGSEFDATLMKNDGEAISQAVELGRSSTGKEWHGKGLPRMREIVENCQGGTLRIASRCGEYVYGNGKSTYRSFEVPLNGTLVEWDLYL